MSLILENFSVAGVLTPAQSAVLKTLLYFDIFSHPLTADELYTLCQEKNLTESEIKNAAESLCRSLHIGKREGYYFVNQHHEVVERRLNGESYASGSLRKAMKYSRKIAAFPFVRAIALSGSISKNYMDAASDIDYFIITSKNRMWLARTLLVLYKKIFLLNSRKYFCVNYFLSEDAMEVPDKNIFTATEISFLIPTYNHTLYRKFLAANNWSKRFLPNFPMRGSEFIVPGESQRVKSLLEKFFSGKFGEKLDSYFFRLTLKYWKRKFRHFDESTFDFRLRSKKTVSKHHPSGFQERVLTKYSENMSAFTGNHQVQFHAEGPVLA